MRVPSCSDASGFGMHRCVGTSAELRRACSYDAHTDRCSDTPCAAFTSHNGYHAHGWPFDPRLCHINSHTLVCEDGSSATATRQYDACVQWWSAWSRDDEPSIDPPTDIHSWYSSRNRARTFRSCSEANGLGRDECGSYVHRACRYNQTSGICSDMPCAAFTRFNGYTVYGWPFDPRLCHIHSHTLACEDGATASCTAQRDACHAWQTTRVHTADVDIELPCMSCNKD